MSWKRLVIRFGVAAIALTTILGLVPILLDTGRGSDVMQPMAIPSVGGMSVTLITLFVIPCCYCLAKEWQLRW